jgi:tryptophan 2,3-dioxygenase
MGTDDTPTYWDYLRVEDLLSLQRGLAGDERDVGDDELLFIVVHQTYELWFKVVLRELRTARDRLLSEHVEEEEVPRAAANLERITTILRHAVAQFEVMETLTPQGFLEFRDSLVPASGFQSHQMREIEILMGLPGEHRLSYDGTDPLDHIKRLAKHSAGGKPAWKGIKKARREPTLKDGIENWLYRTPIRGSGPMDENDDMVVEAFLADFLKGVEDHHEQLVSRMTALRGSDPEKVSARFAAVQQGVRRFLTAEDQDAEQRPRIRRIRAGILFIESYRELPLLAWPRTLLDRVVELEQQFVLWRNRHARMVERMIGRRVGTGGSSGVDYLDETTKYRIFTDLWEVRTLLLPEKIRPELPDAEDYGFRG